MTKWKKSNNIQEGFDNNSNNKEKLEEKSLKTNVYHSPPPTLSSNIDYNMDILHKKMLKIQQKKNNFDKKFVLEDINDYMVEHDAYPDNVPYDEGVNPMDYIDNIDNIDSINIMDNVDTFRSPINPVIEGFSSPICSGPGDGIIKQNQLLVYNAINYPFFVVDFGLQYITDVTCNVFAHVSPELIDLANNINISPEFQDVLKMNVQNIASDTSQGINDIAIDVSNVLFQRGSGPAVDICNNIVNDVSNLINNTTPDELQNIYDSLKLQGTFEQDIAQYKVFTWDDTKQTYVFEYDKWAKFVDSKGPDNQVVKRNIKCFFMVFLAWFITYNWFFLMFYVDNTGHRIRKYDITQDLLARFNKLLDFLFGPLITPVVWLDKILMHFIPDFFMSVSILNSPSFQFIFLMLIIYYVMITYGDVLQTVLNYCINHSITADYGPFYNWFFIFLYVSVFYSFVKSLFDMTPDMLRSTIIIIIIVVLRFILVYFLTPLSGVIIVGYLFVYSYLGMIIYNNYNVFNAMDKVRDYIFQIEYAEKIANISNSCGSTNDKNCKTATLFSTILDLIRNLHLINYVYVIETFLVWMLLLGIADFIQNISSPDLKAGMVILNVLTIVAILAIAMYRNSFTLGSHRSLSRNSKEFASKFKNSCPA